MRIAILMLTLLSLSHFLFSLSPFTLPSFSLSPITEESNDEDDEFEFPPATLPVIDDAFIAAHTYEIIAVSGTGTAAGVGLIIYGILDLLAEVEGGYYTYEINRGILCVSAGLILGGISLTILKTALDTLF